MILVFCCCHYFIFCFLLIISLIIIDIIPFFALHSFLAFLHAFLPHGNPGIESRWEDLHGSGCIFCETLG